MKHPEDFVLMVEDNADDVTLTLRSFDKSGFPYPIVVARDGAQALGHLFSADPQQSGARPRRPVLVLLDLNLPKVTGLAVLKRIREDLLLRDLPVIILSSSNEEKDRSEAGRLSADLYIRKPINFHDFAVVAQQIKDFLAVRAKA